MFENENIDGELMEMYFKDLLLDEEALPQILASRRIHKSNMGTNKEAAGKDYLRILKARLDRQRKMPK